MVICSGGFVSILISYTIIYDIVIPNICYYHLNKMSWFTNLFYSAGSADNGHPSPNLSNFILSFSIGGILANWIYTLVNKSHIIDNQK